MNNRLQIASVENTPQPKPPGSRNGARRQEIQASMERLWLIDPGQFDPDRDVVQRKRIDNLLKGIEKHIPLLEGKRCADLGCGSGKVSFALAEKGAKVDAVDIASQALGRIKAKEIPGITPIQDCLPGTRLEDSAYDLVICTETIGYLTPIEYRIVFAELARLVKKAGIVVCSTSLDFRTDHALERFAALAETEFEIDQWVLRYDLLWTVLCRFFESPSSCIRISRDHFERTQELGKRRALKKLWFRMKTSRTMAVFWKPVSWISTPIAARLRQNGPLVDFLEKITKFFWDESGITHALLFGKRRPLAFPLPPNEIPIERKQKRQVWE